MQKFTAVSSICDTTIQIFRDIRNEVIKPVSGCEKCNEGTIYTPQKKGYGAIASKCDCHFMLEEFKFSAEALKLSAISKTQFEEYTFQNYKETFVTIALLRKFVAGETTDPWLYLSGEPGTGKTYTGVLALLLGLIEQKSVYLANMELILREMRRAISTGSKAGDEAFIRACVSDITVIDDLAQENISDWTREQLYAMIQYRYANKKLTIITSNKGITQLEEELDHPAIISRIKHRSLIATFGDKSLRKNG